MTAPRMIVQMLCLLSYLWASSCLANVLQLHQVSRVAHTQIIVDDDRHALIVHHQGHRDQHEPHAQGQHSLGDSDSDQVIQQACVHSDLAVLASKVAFAQALASDVLLAYLPPPVFSHAMAAQTQLLAQQPPPQTAPPPLSRNSTIAIVQLTNLRI